MSRQHDHVPLDAPRDTSLMVEGRAARERRRKARRQRQRFAVSLALVALTFVVGGWLISRGTQARTATATAEVSQAAGQPAAVASAMEQPQPDPTPLFAAYHDVALHLPVPADQLTEIAFHQASFSYAQRLVTRMPTYRTEAAKDKRGTGRTPEISVADEHGWLGGSVLRLWRANRPGKPDTAADIGAPAGVPVLAPVTGEVLLVKAYRLYEKYPDFQIHIRPRGHDDLDVVLIHVADPKVARGDAVVGGVTQIGRVRNLSGRLHMQLSEYTTSAGDHTHVQVNKVKPGTTEPVTKS